MPNLFKIDFIQGKTDAADYNQVKYSLSDTAANRAIISLSVSADKLQSVSNYSREPKRLVFECFPDTWIQDNILSGDHEHERYISHFEVKVYRDDSLFFSGIIDTSQLSFDIASGILKITCYDKIKLLSVFSDLTHYYSLTAGYMPQWILSYFIQDIMQTIPVNIPTSIQFTIPTLNISSGGALTIAHIDFDDLIAFPNPTGGWNYSYDNSGWPAPYWGFKIDSLANRISLIFAYKKVIKATYPNPATTRYQGRFRGRIYRFFNNVCPVVIEYDEKTDWVEDLASLDNAANEFIGFFIENGIAESTLYHGLASVGAIDDGIYGRSHYVDHWVEAYFHGNLFPAKLFPGKAYENYNDEQTDNIKALQAMLMLYNATLYSDSLGRIVFKNKDAYSADITQIDDADVVSFVIKRGNQQKPDMNALDVLAGDSSQLQDYVQEYLIDFYDSKWACEATIDRISKYNLSLQSKIRIRNQVYAITELERNYVDDEYKVKAWLL